MNLFKIRFYDVHLRQTINNEGGLEITPIDQEWRPFNMYIDTDLTDIIDFREYILFDSDGNPTPCTRVNLSDGSFVFCVHLIDTFLNKLEEHYKSVNKESPN
jgi:hypothetical protein